MVEGIETTKEDWKGGGVAERKDGEVEHQKTMWRKVRWRVKMPKRVCIK